MIIMISIEEILKIMKNISGPVDGFTESHSHLLSNKTNTTKAVSNKVDNVHAIERFCENVFVFLIFWVWTDAGQHNDNDNHDGS